MIGINEKVKVQADHLGRLEKSLENHVHRTDDRFKDQGDRIRSIEFEVIPYKLQIRTTRILLMATIFKTVVKPSPLLVGLFKSKIPDQRKGIVKSGIAILIAWIWDGSFF